MARVLPVGRLAGAEGGAEGLGRVARRLARSSARPGRTAWFGAGDRDRAGQERAQRRGEADAQSRLPRAHPHPSCRTGRRRAPPSKQPCGPNRWPHSPTATRSRTPPPPKRWYWSPTASPACSRRRLRSAVGRRCNKRCGRASLPFVVPTSAPPPRDSTSSPRHLRRPSITRPTPSGSRSSRRTPPRPRPCSAAYMSPPPSTNGTRLPPG